ncbi:hypothetical protein ACS0TY_031782 [Phlomoides rotata]
MPLSPSHLLSDESPRLSRLHAWPHLSRLHAHAQSHFSLHARCVSLTGVGARSPGHTARMRFLLLARNSGIM